MTHPHLEVADVVRQYGADYLARERTMAGLAAARARGRLGGRPRKLNAKQAEMAVTMLKDRNTSIEEVCEAFPHVSRRTLYRLAQASRQSEPRQEQTWPRPPQGNRILTPRPSPQ